MESAATTSKENLHAASETPGETEKMIALLPIPQKPDAAPWNAYRVTASKKTLCETLKALMNSIDRKSSLKKTCGDAAAGRSCTSRMAFQDITARTNIISLV
ncbi:unnamed protein product [Caretta caretta]